MKRELTQHVRPQIEAVALETRLALARWQGNAPAMPQAAWQRQVQTAVLAWLQQGGFGSPLGQTKTAAKGRRSLASQGDSKEECEFTQIRIRDAAM